MSDDDEPAITGDMEPELVPGTMADDDAPDTFEAGAPPSGLVTKLHRGTPRTDATRAAMVEMMARFKAENAERGDDDDEELVAADDALAQVPAALAAKQPVTAAAAAPAASLDPEVGKLREQLSGRLADLDKREASIVEREQSGDLARLGDLFAERPIDAVREVLKLWMGPLDDAAFKDELADLVAELMPAAGFAVKDDVKARLDAKRATKYVKRFKDTQARGEQLSAQKQQRAAEEAEWTTAARQLDAHLVTAEVSPKYPWLASEESPGKIVIDVIRSAQRRDGTNLKWDEAAQKANDYLKNQASAFFDKRRHLLNAAPAKAGDAAGGKTERAQGDPSGIRRSRTLSNAAAASTTTTQPVTPPTSVVNGKWSREAHRRQTRAAFAPSFTPDK